MWRETLQGGMGELGWETETVILRYFMTHFENI